MLTKTLSLALATLIVATLPAHGEWKNRGLIEKIKIIPKVTKCSYSVLRTGAKSVIALTNNTYTPSTSNTMGLNLAVSELEAPLLHDDVLTVGSTGQKYDTNVLSKLNAAFAEGRDALFDPYLQVYIPSDQKQNRLVRLRYHTRSASGLIESQYKELDPASFSLLENCD